MRRIRIEDLLASPEEVAALGALLARGGIAGDSDGDLLRPGGRSRAARRAWGACSRSKRREAAKPLLALFGARRQLAPLGVAAPAGACSTGSSRIWPAPLTVVLPLAAPIPASRDALTLGVRMPAHAALCDLLARIGPVTGTSLNRAGEPPCSDPEAAARLMPDEIDVFVDGGRTPGGLASTLLDATVDPPRVLRAGAFPWPPARR